MSTSVKEDSFTRRYLCACGYGTDVKRCYVEHRRTHTDERPYVCECGARFRRSNHLASHQKRKMVTIDVNNQKVLQCRPVKKRAKPTNPNGGTSRPWKCDCGSTFKWHHLLVSHKRGYSCPYRASQRPPAEPVAAPQELGGGILGNNILHDRNIEITLPRINTIAPHSPPPQPQQQPQQQQQYMGSVPHLRHWDHHHAHQHQQLPQPQPHPQPQHQPPSVSRLHAPRPLTPPSVPNIAFQHHIPHPTRAYQPMFRPPVLSPPMGPAPVSLSHSLPHPHGAAQVHPGPHATSLSAHPIPHGHSWPPHPIHGPGLLGHPGSAGPTHMPWIQPFQYQQTRYA